MTLSSYDFLRAYNECYDKYLEILETQIEVEQLETQLALISGCLIQPSDSKISYPIIVGNILSRASIVNIGTFPPLKFTEHNIYPLNYSVKKRFNPHKAYKKSMQNRVLYVCTVNKDGISITGDDGYVWKGVNVWEEFRSDVNIKDEFKSIEDFMALNHPSIIKMIEEIGDISSFKGYVSIKDRQTKPNVLN